MKISALIPAGPLTGDETLPAVQGGAARGITVRYVFDYVGLKREPVGSRWRLRIGTNGGATVGILNNGVLVARIPKLDAMPPLFREPVGSRWRLRLGTNGGANVGFLRSGDLISKIPAQTSALQSIATATKVRPAFASKTIVIVGDSTGEGAGASDSATTWRALLADRLGITIVNLSLGGRNAEQGAGYYGAVPTTLSVEGGAIPAAGSVALTAIAPEILFNGSSETTRTVDGTIDGAPVRITHNLVDGYTIEQLGAAAPLAVANGALFVPEAAVKYRDATLIVCLGTNDRFNPPHIAVENIVKIATFNRPYFSRVLVVSPRCKRDEVGTAAYDNVLAQARMLRTIFGGNFLDLRGFLVADALGVLGLEPTAADLADIANDVTPERLRAPDFLHSSDLGHQAEAWFYERVLTARSYV